MMSEIEIWRDVLNYEGLYEVSNLGRIKSVARIITRGGNQFFHKERILKPGLSNGYLMVNLHNNKKIKNTKVHKIVAEAFLGHHSCGMELVIDHINNIKTDNRAENLQILTNRTNCSKRRMKYSSKYTGVSWNKSANRWRVSIQINGRSFHVGYFKDEVSASKAYQDELLKTI